MKEEHTMTTLKKIAALILALALCCGALTLAAAEEGKAYRIGICNFVDHESLNQIIANINARLAEVTEETGIQFEINEQNCNTAADVMTQIISDFLSDGVDLMVGVATPVAMTMQAMTEDHPIPVLFAAVSDPLSVGLVDSLEAPGANISGTSDYLDTDAVFNLIFALNPEAQNIALLYDQGQDSSTAPIAAAKALLDAKGVSYREYTGSTVQEVQMAVDTLIADKVSAVFTPTDNTIMTAELSIYEALAENGIPHFTGADSFALNGAFLGYGVDYANLGRETANMIVDVLVNGVDISTLPVKTFDNGTATINTETCAALGLDFEEVQALFAPYCTQVLPIAFAESFDDLN